MPAVRPAQKKADAVIKHVGLRIDADADGEAAVCQFREMGEQGDQRRVEDAAILRRDDAVRTAFEESRGHPARKALQMEGGAAACVPGRDMRRCDLGAGDAGTGEKAGDEILLPGRNRLVPPVLEAASAAGGKGSAVRLATFGRGRDDLVKDGTDALAADGHRRCDDLLSGKCRRDEHRMFVGDVIVLVGHASDTVSAPADMADRQLDRRGVARQLAATVAAAVKSAAVHAGIILFKSVSKAVGEPDDPANHSHLVNAALIVAVGRVVG